MDYMSVRQAADKWSISIRRIQTYLKDKRIEGAMLLGHSWMIPAGAKKPADPRMERNSDEKKSLLSDLLYMIETTVIPMPKDNPDAILDTVSEDRLRLQFEGELAYMRGDFEQVIRCFEKTKGDDAARIRACSLTIAAAISTGNYALYTEIEAYLKDMIKSNIGARMTAILELVLDIAYVSAIAPNMVSVWLKNGDFSALPSKARPDAAYKRSKYFQGLGKFESMLVVAQSALAFYDFEEGISYPSIYLRVSCAAACCALNEVGEARRYLLDALRLSLPHGFITPFAESAAAFGGLLEQCLREEFPEYYDVITKQWQRTFINWTSFHNNFTKDNITAMLSLHESHIATLVSQRVPYKEIATQHNISVGRVKNIMTEVYEKLLINNREDLTKLLF